MQAAVVTESDRNTCPEEEQSLSQESGWPVSRLSDGQEQKHSKCTGRSGDINEKNWYINL